MRFRLPFDDVQYQAAANAHIKMRKNLRDLRQAFPPRDPEETALLKQYRELIQEFARELQKPIARINPARLNELSGRMLLAFVAYASIRGPVN
jgi:hypothetical protein